MLSGTLRFPRTVSSTQPIAITSNMQSPTLQQLRRSKSTGTLSHVFLRKSPQKLLRAETFRRRFVPVHVRRVEKGYPGIHQGIVRPLFFSAGKIEYKQWAPWDDDHTIDHTKSSGV